MKKEVINGRKIKMEEINKRKIKRRKLMGGK